MRGVEGRVGYIDYIISGIEEGDVLTLVDRAQEQFDQEESERLQKKIRKNELDFDDFLSQIQSIKKMGNLKDLIGMIPGMGKMVKDLDISDDAFKHIEAIIRSMTKQERRHPDVMKASRKERVARGSGVEVQDVNRLLKQHQQMNDMMKRVKKLGKKGMMRQGLAGLLPPGAGLPGGMK